MSTVYMKNYQIDPDAETASQPVSSASVQDLVLQSIRLRTRRRVAWLAHLGNNAEDDNQRALDANLTMYLDGRDTPKEEAAWYQHAKAVQHLNEELEVIEEMLAGKDGVRLHQLQNMFRLSDLEMVLIRVCLALAMDPTLAAVYAYLQRHPAHNYATEILATRLFGLGLRSLWTPGGPLDVWGLISMSDASLGEPAPLVIDPLVVDWLNGELRMDPKLVGVVQIIEPRKPLDSWPTEETVRTIRRVLERESVVRILLSGPPSSGRRSFASTIADRFNIQALCVDTAEINDADWPDVYVRAQRLAIMGGMALVWHGCHLQRSWPSYVAPAPIQFVACEADRMIDSCANIIDHRIDLPAPTLDERRALWKANNPESAIWPANEFDALVTRYRVNIGDIVSVSKRAPVSAEEAARFVRELTRHRLGELARLLNCPFGWHDLVIADKLREGLEDFAFEARERTTFWESPGARRLFPRGTGLVALFSGPPGTGKTMAAQVIAAELALDLFRIDLATVVSKYIGETAKHLGQIFTRAARMNAVLLFDEADALFSKRTEVKDAHDRYANADTSYLLQLLEEYRGIVILASNKKQNIDPAFTRRVRYIYEFPRPETAERLRIWRQVIGELNGNEALKRLETTIEALAGNVEMSGAQIKNAVLASIFVARRSREPLAMKNLLRGIERELGKEGRSLGTSERERLMHYGGT